MPEEQNLNSQTNPTEFLKKYLEQFKDGESKVIARFGLSQSIRNLFPIDPNTRPEDIDRMVHPEIKRHLENAVLATLITVQASKDPTLLARLDDQLNMELSNVLITLIAPNLNPYKTISHEQVELILKNIPNTPEPDIFSTYLSTKADDSQTTTYTNMGDLHQTPIPGYSPRELITLQFLAYAIKISNQEDKDIDNNELMLRRAIEYSLYELRKKRREAQQQP